MYIPKRYEGGDINQALAFMQRFNFATIISYKENRPVATHLPFVVREQNSNIILSGHFAKANSQWREIEEGQTLVIFSEPHAYISPSHYEKKQNVPTWNYLAVHAYGKVKLIEDASLVMKLLKDMMLTFEPSYSKQWSKLDSEYKLRMIKGIVAFEIEVQELQYKEKLSQNKKTNERINIINSFESSDEANQKLIAAYMRKKEL